MSEEEITDDSLCYHSFVVYYLSLLSLIAGITLSTVLSSGFLVALGLFLILLSIAFSRSQPGLWLLPIFFWLGAGFFIVWNKNQPQPLFPKTELNVSGEVIESRERGGKSLAILKTRTRRLVILFPKRINLLEGELINIRGVTANPGLDIKRLYKTEKVSGTIWAGSWQKEGKTWLYTLSSLRERIAARIGSILPEPEASLSAGFFMGSSEITDAGLISDLRKTGTSHIVAVSGYNFVIIMASVTGLLGLVFKKRLALILSLLMVPIYALLVGGQGSVKRAAIFIALLFCCRLLYKQTPPLYLLLLAILLASFFNPFTLFFDLSFLLSTLAAFGLIAIAPRIAKLLERAKLPKKLVPVFADTWGAGMAVAPLSAAVFSQNPLPGFLVNLLVVPLIPLSMLSLVVSFLVSFLKPLEAAAVYLAYPAPHFILSIITNSSELLGEKI